MGGVWGVEMEKGEQEAEICTEMCMNGGKRSDDADGGDGDLCSPQ